MNDWRHGQGTHSTKMGAGCPNENTQKASKSFSQNVCPSPKVRDLNKNSLWVSVVRVLDVWNSLLVIELYFGEAFLAFLKFSSTHSMYTGNMAIAYLINVNRPCAKQWKLVKAVSFALNYLQKNVKVGFCYE